MNEHDQWTTYQAECIERLSKDLKRTAIELLEYSGGLDDSGTETMARDIIGNTGLLSYLADCLRHYESDKDKDNEQQKD